MSPLWELCQHEAASQPTNQPAEPANQPAGVRNTDFAWDQLCNLHHFGFVYLCQPGLELIAKDSRWTSFGYPLLLCRLPAFRLRLCKRWTLSIRVGHRDVHGHDELCGLPTGLECSTSAPHPCQVWFCERRSGTLRHEQEDRSCHGPPLMGLLGTHLGACRNWEVCYECSLETEPAGT